ncbi:unnamed protein product [Brassica rapa subsp. narinosa]
MVGVLISGDFVDLCFFNLCLGSGLYGVVWPARFGRGDESICGWFGGLQS